VKKRLRHLPASLFASAVLLALGVPFAWLVSGPAAAAGVVAGIALVTVSYVFSSVVVMWCDLVNPALILPVGLLSYALKFALFGVVMFSVAQVGWAGLEPMGWTVIVATIVWTGAQLWWTLNAKIPYVEFETDR